MLLINAFIQYLDTSVSFPPQSLLHAEQSQLSPSPYISNDSLYFKLLPAFTLSLYFQMTPYSTITGEALCWICSGCLCLVLASPEPVPQHARVWHQCCADTRVFNIFIWPWQWLNSETAPTAKKPCWVRFSGLWKTKAGNKTLQKTFTKLDCTWQKKYLVKGKKK